MNLRQLYYFKTIAELEHYTKAAQVLFISQSSLSHAMQELECELNAQLFMRKGRNITLTKYGELFLPYVTNSLQALETGVSKLNDYINPNTGTVTAACFPSLAQFAPDIMICYVSATNRVNVKLQFNQEATYTQLKEQLLGGNVDMVFATEIPDSRIESSYIGDHELVVLVSTNHRLARYDSVDLRELDSEDFIAFDTASQLREQTDNFFKEFNIHPNITMQTAQDMIIYGLVAANHGVAITPYPLGGAPYNVKILHIENDIPKRKLYLMWNKEQYISPAAEYFRDFVVRSGCIFDDFLKRKNFK